MSLKVVELYSGIGGMHFSLKGSIIRNEADVIFAADLNPTCNAIYKHNFPNTNLQNRNINSLTADELIQLSPDMILMSPPCQPFTRLGKRKDLTDARNTSFLNFIKLIPHLTTIKYMLLENVKGFEESETRNLLLEALKSNNFTSEEFLFNSRQFGVCNSRLRYYLLAKKLKTNCQGRNFSISSSLPSNYDVLVCHIDESLIVPKKIEEVVEYLPATKGWNDFLIPMDLLKKYYLIMDVVALDSERSCCFTQGYKRYFEGTGSVVCDIQHKDIVPHEYKVRNSLEDEKETEDLIRELNLRFFTPNEIARLMCFPAKFSFPNHITNRQRYKAISNSINVYVVSFLISYLLDIDSSPELMTNFKPK